MILRDTAIALLICIKSGALASVKLLLYSFFTELSRYKGRVNVKLTWILVADESQARIFTMETPTSALKEIEALSHPEGRMHEQRLDSDLPGKNTPRVGGGGHSYQGKIGPKEQENIDFAKKLSHILNSAYKAKKFEDLLIIAAPSFLGNLRKQFTESLQRSIVFSLDKNLKDHTLEDIRAHLPMPLH